jgi:hypothetical protein
MSRAVERRHPGQRQRRCIFRTASRPLAKLSQYLSGARSSAIVESLTIRQRRPCCGGAGPPRPGWCVAVNTKAAAGRSWPVEAGPSCPSSMRPSRWRRAIDLASFADARPPSGFGIPGWLQKADRALPPKRSTPSCIMSGSSAVAALAALPDGAMIVVGGSAFALRSGRTHRWTNEGYAPSEKLRHADGLLTPPSTLMALSAGYRPALHPSIN